MLEDLRIDGTGTVHPVGRRAGQHLRARAGDWRLLAAPPEVVLALRARQGRRLLRLAGEVRSHGALCDVLATVAQGGWGGELVVLEDNDDSDGAAARGQDGAVRSIFFEGGNVVGASSTAPGERLGEILWRFGAITREQLEQVVRAADESGRRIGEAALELEFVGPDELFQMMARQVEEVFYAAALVGRATFFLFDGFDAARLGRRHHLSAGALLMEAARRTDELRFFRERIPSDAWVPSRVASARKAPPELEGVLAECDGRRSVAEIGRRIGQLEFEVTRAVFQLSTAGFVSVHPPRPEGPGAILDAFNSALVAIHAACDEASKGPELRSGIEQFATSTGVYVSLFAGAGPLENGSMRGDVVARNLAVMSAGEDGQSWLLQELLEYAGFALFQAGSLLSRDATAALNARVSDFLKMLRQLAEAGLPPSRKRSQETQEQGLPASGRDTQR
jgi:hypothetical protein